MFFFFSVFCYLSYLTFVLYPLMLVLTVTLPVSHSYTNINRESTRKRNGVTGVQQTYMWRLGEEASIQVRETEREGREEEREEGGREERRGNWRVRRKRGKKDEQED